MSWEKALSYSISSMGWPLRRGMKVEKAMQTLIFSENSETTDNFHFCTFLVGKKIDTVVYFSWLGGLNVTHIYKMAHLILQMS